MPSFPPYVFGAPNKRQLAQLRKRRARLSAMAKSVEQATGSMKTVASGPGIAAVYIRNEFVNTESAGPLRGDPSDRRLPDQEDRPPATRLITPRGAVLRLFLTALFEAQARTRPGQHPGNKRPLASRDGGGLSWIDLLASDAVSSGTGKYHMSVSAKKTRQMESAITRLAKEELVELTHTGEPGTRKYEEFFLMHEGGRRPHGPNVPYKVPVIPAEQAFAVPATLFTSGWIHVLEDTELSFILMMAAAHHATGGQPFSIIAENRLLRFGMSHDAYEAHMMLSRLGLVTVTPDPRRRADGTVEEFNAEGSAHPHMLEFIPGGFDSDAFSALTAAIDSRLRPSRLAAENLPDR